MKTSASDVDFAQLLEILPSAESRVLPGGHFLLYEQPELVAGRCYRYIEKADGPMRVFTFTDGPVSAG